MNTAICAVFLVLLSGTVLCSQNYGPYYHGQVFEGRAFVVGPAYYEQSCIPQSYLGYQGNFNYYHGSQTIQLVIQLVPVQCVMLIAPPQPQPELKMIPYQPRGRARGQHLQQPQVPPRPRQAPMQLVKLVKPTDPFAFLKTAIYDSLKQSDIVVSLKRFDINLKTFIYGLSENQISLSVPAEVHLTWLIEFVCTRYQTTFHENILDYFDYIKTFHLKPELEHNPSKRTNFIEAAIIKFIHHRCSVPEITVQLVEMIGTSMDAQKCDCLYAALLTSIHTNQFNLSRNGVGRYMATLESFLKHLRIIPFHITQINEGEGSISILRIIYHFVYLYEILMGFRDCTQDEVKSAFIRANQYSNGVIMTAFLLERFRALEMILKRAFIHIMQSDKEKEMEILLDRYESVARILREYNGPDQCKSFVTYRLNHLLDLYFYFSTSDPDYDIGFTEFVVMSYFGDTNDKFGSLYQVAIYLSNYEITLDFFRASFKDDILYHGVDEDYVLVLEAIIAAVEDVVCEEAEHFSWEPSVNFLQLQDKIMKKTNPDARNRFALLESPYLMLAAKIYLSRITGFPISFFVAATIFTDGFSWTDAIDFVNFFYDLFFPGHSKSLRIKSQFFNDVKSEFPRVPTLQEMIALHGRNNYENIKREPAKSTIESSKIALESDEIALDSAEISQIKG